MAQPLSLALGAYGVCQAGSLERPGEKAFHFPCRGNKVKKSTRTYSIAQGTQLSAL